MKLLFFTSIILLGLSGCVKDKQEESSIGKKSGFQYSQDIYPLAIGNIWEYDLSLYDTSGTLKNTFSYSSEIAYLKINQKTGDTFYAAYQFITNYYENNTYLSRYYRNVNHDSVVSLDTGNYINTEFKLNPNGLPEKIGTIYSQSSKKEYYFVSGDYKVPKYFDANCDSSRSNKKSYLIAIYTYNSKNKLVQILNRYWTRGVGLVGYEFFMLKNEVSTDPVFYLAEKLKLTSVKLK